VVIMTTTTSGSTWTNAVYQSELTCWGPGGPGHCGPEPIVRPGNLINFSYGLTDISQSHVIADILPNSGLGLQVTGYVFGFRAKNGNGWDDGRVDVLSAYVTVTDVDGKIIERRDYDLNYQFNWTNFVMSETFDQARPTAGLGTVTYGFVGMDNNGWAGTYGPEVTNVTFSLRYSMDPCWIDPLWSTSCPGYWQAFQDLMAQSQASIPMIDAEDSVTTSVTADVTQIETVSDVGGVEISTSGVLDIPDSRPEVVRRSRGLEPVPVDLPQREEDSRTASELLALISRATDDSAALQTARQSQAQSVSAEANPQDGIGLAEISAIEDLAQGLLPHLLNSDGQGLQIASINTVSAQIMDSISADLTPISLGSRIMSTAVMTAATSDMPVELDQLGVSDTVIDQDLLTTTVIIINETPATVTSETRRETQAPQQLAGGADAAVLTRTPQDFASYLDRGLQDARFYQQREIYRGQRTVDNQTVLRRLSGSSDRLHQQMIDQQYGR